jgi:hypothetical protein
MEDPAAVLKKLGFKAPSRFAVSGLPAELANLRAAMAAVSEETGEETAKIPFILAFVRTLVDVEHESARWAHRLEGDGQLWMAYVKKSSPLYQTGGVTRDSSWQPLGDAGFEPVMQIALDEDWSALRFRKAEYIKTLKRDASWVMSEAGKQKKAEGK